MTLTETAGSIVFNGALTADTLNTAVQGYNLAINAGATITNAATLSNTGTLTLGDTSADTLTFGGGNNYLDTGEGVSTIVLGNGVIRVLNVAGAAPIILVSYTLLGAHETKAKVVSLLRLKKKTILLHLYTSQTTLS